MTEVRALVVVCLACVGCASTSGHDWLNSPVNERAELRVEGIETPPSASESRPRLRHTVTLGETYVAAATPAASSAGASSVTQVNVHTHVPIVVNNYGGYGYGGYGYGSYGSIAPVRATQARATSGAPTKVGGDFPAPPDYGPRAMK